MISKYSGEISLRSSVFGLDWRWSERGSSRGISWALFLQQGWRQQLACFLYCTSHNRDSTLLPPLPPKRGCTRHPHRMTRQARVLGGCARHAFPRGGNQWSIHSSIQILIHLTTVWMNSIMFGAKETLMKRIDLVSALIILTAQQRDRITVKHE